MIEHAERRRGIEEAGKDKASTFRLSLAYITGSVRLRYTKEKEPNRRLDWDKAAL